MKAYKYILINRSTCFIRSIGRISKFNNDELVSQKFLKMNLINKILEITCLLSCSFQNIFENSLFIIDHENVVNGGYETC